MNFRSRLRWAAVGVRSGLWHHAGIRAGLRDVQCQCESYAEGWQRAINRAIFVMLAPPVAIMVFGFGFAVRYGKRRDEENGAATED